MLTKNNLVLLNMIKQSLVYEEELDNKLEILENKLATSFEKNSQIQKDLKKIKKELSQSLK